MAYALYKNGEVLARGSVKQVWEHALFITGDITVIEFARQGYSIEPIRITAAGRMQ